MDVREYETTILEKIRSLPEEKLIGIMDYINFLQCQIEGVRQKRGEAVKRMEERRKRLGPTGIKACELVAQGRERAKNISSLSAKGVWCAKRNLRQGDRGEIP